MDDVTAVLDACGSARTVLSAEVEGAMLAVIYAATYPDRVSHLVLTHPMARLTDAPGYDWTWEDDAERLREFTMPLLARWGTGESARDGLPGDVRRATRRSRSGGGGGSASPPRRGRCSAAIELVAQLDVREILPRVQAPTLVLHRPGAAQMNPQHAEYFAEHIPSAKLISLPGRDAASFGDGVDAWMEAVEEFTHGHDRPARSGARPRHGPVHRHRRLDEQGGGARRQALAGDARASRPHHPRARRRLRRPGDQVDGRRLPRDLRRARAGGPVRDDPRAAGRGARHRAARRPAHRRGRADRRRRRRHGRPHRRPDRGPGRARARCSRPPRCAISSSAPASSSPSAASTSSRACRAPGGSTRPPRTTARPERRRPARLLHCSIMAHALIERNGRGGPAQPAGASACARDRRRHRAARRGHRAGRAVGAPAHRRGRDDRARDPAALRARPRPLPRPRQAGRGRGRDQAHAAPTWSPATTSSRPGRSATSRRRSASR